MVRLPVYANRVDIRKSRTQKHDNNKHRQQPIDNELTLDKVKQQSINNLQYGLSFL